MTVSPLARRILHILAGERPDEGFAWAPGAGPEQPCPIHGAPGPMTGDLQHSWRWWSGAEVQRMLDEAGERVRTALTALVRAGLVETREPSQADRNACDCPGPRAPRRDTALTRGPVTGAALPTHPRRLRHRLGRRTPGPPGLLTHHQRGDEPLPESPGRTIHALPVTSVSNAVTSVSGVRNMQP